jgi:DNA polymerase bacteriophage-type
MANPLIGKMRSLLVAPPGHRLIIADAAQIEARITFWLAGEADALEAFSLGKDLYSEFASRVFVAPVWKPRKDDPPPVTKLQGVRRHLGKISILGLGYGMGKDRFLEYAATYPELAPLVDSGRINLLFATDVVNLYRSTYAGVPDLWDRLERAFRWAVKYETGQLPRGPGPGSVQPDVVHHLQVFRQGSTVVIRLPSGRCLFYPHAQCSGIANGNRISYHWGSLWGGLLTENVVQAISRDLLAEAALRLDPLWPVVHLLHDEVVMVAPEKEAAAASQAAQHYMTKVPAWAEGLPLDAETKICLRYEK